MVAGELKKIVNRISIKKLSNISASFGVINYKGENSLDTIFKRLDEAMYKAKTMGGNTIFSEYDFDEKRKNNV